MSQVTAGCIQSEAVRMGLCVRIGPDKRWTEGVPGKDETQLARRIGGVRIGAEVVIEGIVLVEDHDHMPDWESAAPVGGA